VEYICAADWKDAPHVALANLKTYDKHGNQTMEPDCGLKIDENALQRFIKTYGVLNGVRKNREDAYISGQIHKLDDGGESFCPYVDENDKPLEAGSFDQRIEEIVDLQYELRHAWAGKGEQYEILDSTMELNVMTDDAFKVSFDGPIVPIGDNLKGDYRKPSLYKFEKVILATDDLSKLICYSFLRDFYAGNIGVCGNPNCPARYYLKRRKDQKFCESGCSVYAQRQYSLNWWRENRQGKQAKKRSKSPLKKRK
jgi:hypothetical protein